MFRVINSGVKLLLKSKMDFIKHNQWRLWFGLNMIMTLSNQVINELLEKKKKKKHVEKFEEKNGYKLNLKI